SRCLRYFFYYMSRSSTSIFTLSLHDALPISAGRIGRPLSGSVSCGTTLNLGLTAGVLALLVTATATLPCTLGARAATDVAGAAADPKSTRLNSSHVKISYAGFCLKK